MCIGHHSIENERERERGRGGREEEGSEAKYYYIETHSPNPRGRDDDNNNPILGKRSNGVGRKERKKKELTAQSGAAAIHNVGISLVFVEEGGH